MHEIGWTNAYFVWNVVDLAGNAWGCDEEAELKAAVYSRNA